MIRSYIVLKEGKRLGLELWKEGGNTAKREKPQSFIRRTYSKFFIRKKSREVGGDGSQGGDSLKGLGERGDPRDGRGLEMI